MEKLHVLYRKDGNHQNGNRGGSSQEDHGQRRHLFNGCGVDDPARKRVYVCGRGRSLSVLSVVARRVCDPGGEINGLQERNPARRDEMEHARGAVSVL